MKDKTLKGLMINNTDYIIMFICLICFLIGLVYGLIINDLLWLFGLIGLIIVTSYIFWDSYIKLNLLMA